MLIKNSDGELEVINEKDPRHPKCKRCGKPYRFSDTPGNRWCSENCQYMAKLDSMFFEQK